MNIGFAVLAFENSHNFIYYFPTFFFVEHLASFFLPLTNTHTLQSK